MIFVNFILTFFMCVAAVVNGICLSSIFHFFAGALYLATFLMPLIRFSSLFLRFHKSFYINNDLIYEYFTTFFQTCTF